MSKLLCLTTLNLSLRSHAHSFRLSTSRRHTMQSEKQMIKREELSPQPFVKEEPQESQLPAATLGPIRSPKGGGADNETIIQCLGCKRGAQVLDRYTISFVLTASFP